MSAFKIYVLTYSFHNNIRKAVVSARNDEDAESVLEKKIGSGIKIQKTEYSNINSDSSGIIYLGSNGD